MIELPPCSLASTLPLKLPCKSLLLSPTFKGCQRKSPNITDLSRVETLKKWYALTWASASDLGPVPKEAALLSSGSMSVKWRRWW